MLLRAKFYDDEDNYMHDCEDITKSQRKKLTMQMITVCEFIKLEREKNSNKITFIQEEIVAIRTNLLHGGDHLCWWRM